MSGGYLDNQTFPNLGIITKNNIKNINSGLQFYCKESDKKHQHFWKIIRP